MTLRLTSKLISLTLGSMMGVLGSAAGAATIGNAVLGDGTDVAFASSKPDAEERTTLVGVAGGTGATESDIIRYYAALDDSTTPCLYGVEGCGETADIGNGAGPVQMYVDFIGVDGGSSFLNLYFEDLDLIGATDDPLFLESVSVFDNGGSLLGSFDDITDPGAAGDFSTQQFASIDLGILTAGSDYRVRLDLFSEWLGSGNSGNTDEYLLAVIDSKPVVSTVPVPAAGFLLMAGLGGLGAMKRRRKTEA